MDYDDPLYNFDADHQPDSLRAKEANPSPASGFAGGQIKSVWRSFVGEKAFQEANREPIAAEQQMIRQSQAASNQEKWGGDNGKLFRRVGNQIEEFDAEQYANDPNVGHLARKSIFDRERRNASRREQEIGLELADPSWKTKELSDTDRKNFQLEASVLDDKDPRKSELQAKLAADQEARTRKDELDKQRYELRRRNFEMDGMDPEAWWQSRQAPEQPDPQREAVAAAQAERQRAEVAERSAANEEAELRKQLAAGVDGKKLPEIQSRLAEIQAAREKIGEEKAKAGSAIESVQNEAKSKLEQANMAAKQSGMADGRGTLYEGVADNGREQKGSGDFLRGAETSVRQVPQLFQGVVGLVGETLEKTVGVGASMRDWGFNGYKDAAEKAAPLQRENDDVTKAWAKAKDGDIGAMVDWAQYGLGYALGQIAESAAVAGIGALAGGAAGAAGGTAAAPVAGTAVGGAGGAIAGAASGVVAKGAVKNFAQELIEKAISKQAMKMAEKQIIKEGGKASAEAVAKRAGSEAMRKAAGRQLGSNIGVMSNALGMELGSIYPEAVEQAKAEGRDLSGTDLARIWGAGIAAGGIEGLTDKLGIDIITGKFADALPGGRLASALAGGLAGVGIEGGTEFAQTAIERFGAGKELAGEEARNEYINAAALGGLGGGVVGGAGGLVGGKPGDQKPDLINQVNTAVTADNAEHEAVSPEEMARALPLAKEATPQGVAQAVLLERELATIEQEDSAAVQQAQAAVEAAKASGDTKAVKMAEEALEKVGGRADKARAVVKIASGADPFTDLTAGELKALGWERTESGDIKPIKGAELAAYPGPDGMPIITDAALKEVEGVSARARSQVSMTEAQTLAMVKQRMNTPTWDVPLRDGTTVQVRAATADEAMRKAAGEINLQLSGQLPTQSNSTNGQAQPQQEQTPAAEQAGAEGNPEGTGARAEQIPASQAQTPADPLTERAYKRIEKLIKKSPALGELIDFEGDGRAAMEGGRIKINPEQILATARQLGMSDAEAFKYFNRVLDEEISHLAQEQAAQAKWRELGEPVEYSQWREEYYGSAWRDEFVATGKADTARDLYTSGEEANIAEWEAMSDANKFFEATRQMMQGAKTTEGAFLWGQIGQKTRELLEAALKQLKSIVASIDASPNLKQTINEFESALQGLRNSPDRSQKPLPGKESAGNRGKAQEDSNRSTPSDDEAQSPRRDEAGSSRPQRVSFERNGETLTGRVERESEDGTKYLIKLDEPDSDGYPRAVVPKGDVQIVEESPAAKAEPTTPTPQIDEQVQIQGQEQGRQEELTPAAKPAGEQSPAAEGWTATHQKEYKKRKTALIKAINAKDWNKVLELVEKDLAYFKETGYPDDWSSRWENAADDARLALKQISFVEPITKPFIEKKTEGKEPKQDELSAIDDELTKELDGLFTAKPPQTYTKPIPADRFSALLPIVNKYIEAGVDSPEKLAARLKDLMDGRIVPLSQSIWGLFKTTGVEGPWEPDWASLYAADEQSEPEKGEASFSEAKRGAIKKVAEAVRELLLGYEDVTADRVKKTIPESSTLTRKELDEAMEAGITAAVHVAVSTGRSQESIFKRLIEIYQNQPSLNAKTSESKINQAYSTPAPLAYVASRLADIQGGKTIVEPSAGHGMLLLETTPEQDVQANEIDPARIERTKDAIPNADKWEITNNDGTTWLPDGKVDRVIANPPFGSIMGEDGKNVVFKTAAGETTAIDHAIMLKSLEGMGANGRAVFIIGGPAKTARSEEARKAHYGKGAKAAFFKHLHDNYGVVDHFTVDGDLYSKQGAGWNVDVIVIQGKGKSRTSLPSVKPPRMISTWGELLKTTDLTDENRIANNQLTEEEVRNDLQGGLAALGNLQRQSRDSDGTDREGNGSSGSDRPVRGEARQSSRDPEAQEGGSDTAGDGYIPSDGKSPRRNADQGNVGGSSSGQTSGNGRVSGRQNQVNDFQTKYVPATPGFSLDTLIPKNLAKPVADALAALVDRRGPLKPFVTKELGYPEGTDIGQYFAGEQIDAIAMAIDNFYRDGALIVGDQTGIGKGRVVAGLIKWATNNGVIPVFVTKDLTLMNAMLEDDLPDINYRNVTPAITNGEANERDENGNYVIKAFGEKRTKKIPYGRTIFEEIASIGGLPDKADAVFTTYAQISADTPREIPAKDRQAALRGGEAPPGYWRMEALRKIASNALFILDESHLAGGQSTIGFRFQELLGKAKHVYFSSATFAKRPENMGLYFRTNMKLVSGGNMGKLIQLMEQGGVPAMQLASNMLAADGQMIRRERSFDGVDFETVINFTDQERDFKTADSYTEGLRRIVKLQSDMAAAADAINAMIATAGKRMEVPASGRPRLESQNFSSKLHNMVSQYLLSIKTESAVTQALKEIRAGNKVVLTVQNTMETAIESLRRQNLPLTFKGLLLSYVDSMRFFQEKKGFKVFREIEIRRDPPAEFADKTDRELEGEMMTISRDAEGEKVIELNNAVIEELIRRRMIDVFIAAENDIKKLEISDKMPLSPIDYMRQRMEAEGVTTNEITGRSAGIDENGDVYERSKPSSTEVMDSFNNDNTNFLILNQSGSTGISLHASEKFKDQRQRTMIVVQPNLDINEFMQTLGRIHRSGQVKLPRFLMIQTALPAEKRPAAILGKKMSMLNANTTSNDESAVSEGNESVDIFNKYGDEVVFRILQADRDLVGRLVDFEAFRKKFFDERSNSISPWSDIQSEIMDQPDGYFARFITGYAAILPAADQEHFWERIESEYRAEIAYLDQMGKNDLKADAKDIKAKTISKEVFTTGLDSESVFAQPSYVETVEAEIGTKPITGSEADKIRRDAADKKSAMQNALAERARAFIKKEIDRKSGSKNWDEEKRREYTASQNDQFNRIASAVRMMGSLLTYKRTDGSTGMAVIEDITFNEEKPLTPSSQIVQLKVNDTNHSFSVPVTKLLEDFTVDSSGGGITTWEETKDESSIRSIVTGNLLAAKEALGRTGQVISYTTDSGETQMGILLPNNYTKKQAALAKARTPINSAEELAKAIAEGKRIRNEDNAIQIRRIKDGGLPILSVPASRAAGGQYWRRPSLNRLVEGGSFNQVSSTMRGEFKDIPAMFAELNGALKQTLFVEAEVSQDEDAEGEGLRTAQPPTGKSDGQSSGRGLMIRYAEDPNTGIKSIQANGIGEWNQARRHLASEAARFLKGEGSNDQENGPSRPVTQNLKARLLQIPEHDSGSEAAVRIVRGDSVYRTFPIEIGVFQPLSLVLRDGPRGFLLANRPIGTKETLAERVILANTLDGFRPEEIIGYQDNAVITRSPEMREEAGEAQIDQWLSKHQYPFIKIGDRMAIMVSVDDQKWLINDLHEENFRVAEDGKTYVSDFTAVKISNEDAKRLFSQKTLDDVDNDSLLTANPPRRVEIDEVFYEPVSTKQDAERLFADGRNLVVIHEMDEEVVKIESLEMLGNYGYDMIYEELGGLNTASAPERAAEDFNKTRSFYEKARAQQRVFPNSTGVDPRFSNPGATAQARELGDISRVIDQMQREVRKDADTFKSARELLAEDEAGVEKMLMEAAYGEDPPLLRDHEQLAVDMLINKRVEESNGDAAKLAETMQLYNARIINRRETARALRIGFDKYLSPAERAQAQLVDAIFTIPRQIELRAKKMPFSERRQFLNQEGAKRLAEIEKELSKMGVRLKDLTAKNKALALENSRMMKEVVKSRNAIEQKVLEYVQRGASLVDIRRALGKDVAKKAQKVVDEARAALSVQLREMLAKGMTREQIKEAMADKLKSAAAPTGAGSNGNQIDAMIEAMLEEDFGLPKAIPETNAPRSKKTVEVKVTAPIHADWSRPTFTKGLEKYTFDTKDRTEIMRSVMALQDLASAVGTISALTGKAKTQAMDQLKALDAILAKYGTDSQKVFEAGEGVPSFRFDITDTVQVAAIARTISALDADVVDKATEYFYSSMLSGLQTMLVNATAAIPAAWESTVGRGVEMAINFFIKDPMAAQFGEAKYVMRALAPSISRAKSNFVAAWKAEHSVFDQDVNSMPIDWDTVLKGTGHRMMGSIKGKLGSTVRIPMRLLMATDDFNRTVLAMANVGAYAYRIAKTKGMKDGSDEMNQFIQAEVNTPGSVSFMLASQKAATLIYANPLPGQTDVHQLVEDGEAPKFGGTVPVRDIGDSIGWLAGSLTKAVATDHDHLLAKTIAAILRVSFFPFQRTPFNIMRRGARHVLNPISLTDIMIRMVQNKKAGRKMMDADVIERVSQQLQGAIIMTALVAMAAGEGDEDDMDKPMLITGSQPFNPTKLAERDARMRAGVGPYRISFRGKDGKERFGFSYGRLEPMATALAATVDTIRNIKRSVRRGEGAGQAGMAVLGSLGAQAKDKTFMRGFSDFVELSTATLTEPDIEKNRRLKQFTASRAAMVVPNFVKQPIREADPAYRERADSFMEELLYQAAPYGQKEAKVDAYGQPVMKPGTTLSRIIDVTESGKEQVNPYDAMLLRWSESGKGKAWFPSRITTATFKNVRTGEEQQMDEAQLAEFRELAGKRVMAMLKSRSFNLENPSVIDVEAMKDIHSKARSDIKKALAYKFSRE